MHPKPMHHAGLPVGILTPLLFHLSHCLPTIGSTVTIPGEFDTPSDHVDLLRKAEETRASANPNVAITIHNTVASGKKLWVYIAGEVDTSGSQSMLLSNGNWHSLSAGGSDVPVNITTDVAIPVEWQKSASITLPSYVSSSRLYAFEGTQMDWQMVSAESGATTLVQPVVTEPGTVAYDNRWGFMEFSSNKGEFFVDVSYVDFVSLAFGISLTEESGESHSVPSLMQTLPGNSSSHVIADICADLKSQAKKDGNAWGKLCTYGNKDTGHKGFLRILSPQDAIGRNVSFADSNYYDEYVSRVWKYYSTRPLYIDTQAAGLGTINDTIVSCKVEPASDQLVCSGTSVGMPRPTTDDIWGCNSGAFAINATADDAYKAIVPRVCAAFTRSTLLVRGGDQQPGPAVKTFYKADITNHYARIVHEHEVGGGYAFSYDDVGIGSGQNQEGAIQSGGSNTAKTLKVYVGH